MKKNIRNWLLIISIIVNFLFIIIWGWNKLNSPTHNLGRLEKNLTVGYFGTDSVLFSLPKGLTVRDRSEQGINAIGQFENNRFDIVISSEDLDIVNYDLPMDSLDIFGNYYSAEVLKYKE